MQGSSINFQIETSEKIIIIMKAIQMTGLQFFVKIYNDAFFEVSRDNNI